MYSFSPSTGVVTRDSDGAVCSPVQSTEDPLFIEYQQWIDAGNEPTVIE